MILVCFLISRHVGIYFMWYDDYSDTSLTKILEQVIPYYQITTISVGSIKMRDMRQSNINSKINLICV